MKPYLTLCIALSLLGTVLSSPMLHDDFGREQFDDRAEMSPNLQDYNYQKPPQDGLMQYYDAYPPDTQSYADTQGEHTSSTFARIHACAELCTIHNSVVITANINTTCIYWQYPVFSIGGEGEIRLPEEDIEELKKRPRDIEELAEAEGFFKCPKWLCPKCPKCPECPTRRS